MADPSSDSVLKILIQMGYDPEAAKAALADLDQLKTGTKGAGAETSDYSKELDKAGDAQQGFTLKGHGTREMFYQLNRIIPESGLLLRAAFLGPMGLILGLIVAVRGAISAFEEYNQRLDDIATRAAQPLDGGVQTLIGAWNSARDALGKYLAAMDTAGEDTDTTATLIKNAKELATAKVDATKKIIEAEGALEEARMRAEGKSELDISAAKARNKAELDSLGQGKTVAELEAEKAVLDTPGMGATLAEATDKARKAKAIPDAKALLQSTELKALQDSNNSSAVSKPESGLVSPGDTKELEAAVHLRQVALSKLGVGDVKSGGVGEELKAVGLAAISVNFGAEGALQASEVMAEKRLQEATETLSKQRERQKQLEAEGAETVRKKTEADDALTNAENAEKTFRKRSVEVPIELAQTKKVAATESIGSSDAAAVQRQADLIKSGAMAHPEATFADADKGIQDINKLVKQTGESYIEITARGQAAQIEAQNLQPGQTLSPDKVKDIENFTRLQKDQDVIQALKDLDRALGINAEAMIGTINSIASGQNTSASLHEIELRDLAAINTRLVALKQQVDASTYNRQ